MADPMALERRTPPAERAAATVLLVDDTESGRYATARTLQLAGYRVLEAASGAEALALAAERPELVVLDVNLPDVSGYEVVRRLKADPATAGIPVMHLTANRRESADQAHGLEMGADAFLTQPIDPPVFLATVRALLRAGAADREARGMAAAWQATFEAIAEPVLLLGQGGEVRRANAAAAALTGWRPEHDEPLPTLLGRRFGDAAGAHARLLIADPASRPVRGAELRLGGQLFLASVSPVVLPGEPAGAAVCVLTDVTAQRAHERERERLLEAADAARQEAEQANQAKSDFLAVMSHELRTPLNAIAGYVELLALGIRGPVTEAQRRDLERIRRSQRLLLSHINDILNFARLEGGHVTFELERVAVDEALRAAADFVRPQLADKALRYDYRPAADAPHVRADAEKLLQILLNLLSNAVKFTPAGGAITVRAEPAGDRVRVVVSDTGRGVPVEKRESIFDPFVQVDRMRTRHPEGIGLGLAISRDLARRMGGELVAEEAEGGGARFVLTLVKDERPASSV